MGEATARERALIGFRLLAVVLFLATLAAVSEAAPAKSVPRSFSGVVTHVADGDTLDVTIGQRVERIRLDGIDAPESGQPFGTRARTHLRALAFSQRASVNVKNTDRWGRLVARVIVGGKDISEEMLAAGLAWHYVEYSSDPRLAALEKQARARRLGLWADQSPVPPWVARRSSAPRSGATGGAQSRSANRTPDVPGPYHGNVSSHVYHAPGCREYECRNCREVFSTWRQADAAGYRPHDACVFTNK
jgi:micrococcal nuclease